MSKGFDGSRFQLVERLGAGGFGVVYRVRDLKQGGEVALKTLEGTHPHQLDRLKREFRMLANLRHRNLVAYYELFVERDQAYFTMEYVPGRTFLHHLRRDSEVDHARVRDALAQLATGLSFLHDAGKLHRDIKPANVLVTPDGRVVLLDFGLATEIAASKLGSSIELVGSPDYMSRQQARGEPLTAASDWYSVGVMLYQTLTGRLPFSGGWAQLVAEQRPAIPPPPRDLDARIPEDLSHLCLSLLAHDPDRRAGAQEIFGATGQMASPPPAPVKRNTVLLGREAELERLRGALARVQEGEGVTVLVDGNSGVGKTALVEHFLRSAEEGGATIVLRGRCYEREQVPYQGIDSLIDDVCRLLRGLDPLMAERLLPRHLAALVRLFPILERVPVVAEHRGRGRVGRADEQEIRRQAFGALRELLVRIADEKTLVVHIDDLQWGDLDTAGLLRDVLRPPDSPAMLCVLAYRREDQEHSPCLRVLAQEPIGTEVHLSLGPLAADAAEALVRELLPSRRDDADVSQLVSEAGGNPFLLEEVAHFAGLQEGAGVEPSRLDIQAALGARVGRLPAQALELLQTIALAGHPITEQVALSAAALEGSASDAWHLLVNEHLVRVSGPSGARLVETFHDRVRETVTASLTPQRARACHRGLAAALEQAGSADPEVLARHHTHAGNPERALEFTVAAASQATRALAFDRAARLLENAMSLAGGDHARRVALLGSLAEALGNAGRCIESARVYQEAANAAEPAARVVLRRRAADQLLFAGKIDEGRALIRDDLRAQGVPVPRTPGRTLASVLLLRARIRLRGLGFRPRARADLAPEALAFLDHLRSVAVVMSFVDVGLGAEIGARFLLRAQALGEPHFFALGLALLAGHSGVEKPDSPRTRRLFEEMTRHGKSFEDPAVRGTLIAVRGLHSHFAGRWRDAVQELDQAEEILRDCQGVVCELWSTRAVGIWSRFFLGEWDALTRRVSQGLGDARDRGNAYGMAGVSAPFGVAAWLAQDRPDEARRVLEEVTGTWSVSGFQIQHYWFLMAESLVQLYQGNGPGAWREICRRWKTAAASLTLRFPANKAQLLHMRGCCALAAAEQSPDSERRSLIREAELAARRLRRVGVPYAAPLADLLRAGVAAQRGVPGDAVAFLDAATAGLDRQEMRVHVAAARRCRARLRGEAPPGFLPGQAIASPDAITRMLAPGFGVS